jgi:ABC-2 type transport system permease protein
VALLLFGMALISIGMFISSLTENQVIAATGGFAAGLMLLFIDFFAARADNAILHRVLTELSFSRQYDSFLGGIFDWGAVFFFFCVAAVFVFLTIRVIEKRRWS